MTRIKDIFRSLQSLAKQASKIKATIDSQYNSIAKQDIKAMTWTQYFLTFWKEMGKKSKEETENGFVNYIVLDN